MNSTTSPIIWAKDYATFWAMRCNWSMIRSRERFWRRASALSLIELAASITVESYFADTGKKLLHGQAHAAILAASVRASKDLKMELKKMNLENLKR